MTVPADLLARVGFRPGDRVSFQEYNEHLTIARDRDAGLIFERWRGIDHASPPRSIEELVAELRELRGHDDLD